MSLNLLPVKTGNEQFPVSYLNYLPAIESMRSIVSTISHKVLYIAAEIQIESTWRIRMFALNLLNWNLRTLGDIEYTTVDSSSIGGILVDDTHIYISRMNQPKIFVFDVLTLNLIHSYQYDSSNVGAYGKMTWVDSHTIALAYTTGFVFFDTNGNEFINHLTSTSIAANDISSSDKIAIANYQTGMLVYDIDNDAFTPTALTLNAKSASAYDNGKFYIAQAGYLYIMDENTKTITRTIVTSWTTPRNMVVTNSTVFVICENSNRLYMYDTTANFAWYIVLPWTIPNWSGSYQYIPSAGNGLCMFPYLTMCQFNYSGYSKYNFGPKAQSFGIMYNVETESHFTSDTWIDFAETYATMTDGGVNLPLIPVENHPHVSSVSISKSDYRILKSLRIR